MPLIHNVKRQSSFENYLKERRKTIKEIHWRNRGNKKRHWGQGWNREGNSFCLLFTI